MGCFYLGFTGGEPFMRKDLIDILWFAKRMGFELIIYTNGSLINEEIAQELQRLRPNKVDITIPAMSKNAFERITGLIGSRDKIFKTINLLYKNEVNLGFKTCVLKENESEIKEIQDFTHSLGALHRLDDMLSLRLDGSGEPYKYRGVLKENLVASRKSYVVGDNLEVEGQKSDCDSQVDNQRRQTNNLFKCGVGISQAAITPLGELKMCLMIDYPKYKISIGRKSQWPGLKAAWEKLKELTLSIKPDGNYRCDKCNFYAYCNWCPAKGWLENRSFTICDPESRRKAERISQTLKLPSNKKRKL